GDGSIVLWDAITGRQRGQLEGHKGEVFQVCFSQDGRMLASGSADGTVLLWDMKRLSHNDRSKEVPLRSEEVATYWRDLADGDARGAYMAIRHLAEGPQQTVPFLRERLRPVPKTDSARIAQLIGQLNSDQFPERKKAVEELDRLAEAAEPALRKALEGQPSEEMRRQITMLLEKLQGSVPPPTQLQALRAVEVLERIGTPEAKEVLKSL